MKLAKEYKNPIPKGNSEEDVNKRNEIIVECLLPLINKHVDCNAFVKDKVKFEFRSIDETACHASKRYESTLAALRIEEALKNAVFVKRDVPKSQKQKKKMGFTKIYELKSFLEDLGEVKIIVGERKKQKDHSLLHNQKIRPTKINLVGLILPHNESACRIFNL